MTPAPHTVPQGLDVSTASPPLVEVEDLRIWFPLQRDPLDVLLRRPQAYVRAVDGISFRIQRGEVFGLAGESGSGKTTTGRLILRLLEPTGGRILFDGQEITHLKGEPLRRLRRRMQPIFQDPTASLNPRMRLGRAIGHGLEIHGLAQGEEVRRRVLEILERVGLTPPEAFYDKYPHQLSGGQRQRAVIARALVLHPDLVVADEPIAMADVSVRVRLLELMAELKEVFGLTYLFITHDLATARYLCDRIGILYLGKLVEVGPLAEVYRHPQHPYTEALLAAVPVPDPRYRRTTPMPRGEIPSAVNPPSGCRFHPRCPLAKPRCAQEEPELVEVAPGHWAACPVRAGRW